MNHTIVVLLSHILAQSDTIGSQITTALFALALLAISLSHIRHLKSGALKIINQFFVAKRFNLKINFHAISLSSDLDIQLVFLLYHII